jgi:hypothetical protein
MIMLGCIADPNDYASLTPKHITSTPILKKSVPKFVSSRQILILSFLKF